QMDQSDPQWRDHPEFREWQEFMDEYYPEGDRNSNLTGYAYAACMALRQVLEQAGDDLSRANIMAEAANLRGVRIPMLLPGIRVETSPTDYAPIESMQLQRFEGEGWMLFGEVVST